LTPAAETVTTRRPAIKRWRSKELTRRPADEFNAVLGDQTWIQPEPRAHAGRRLGANRAPDAW